MKENKVLISSLPSECTTIIVGQDMTADGSMIVARSEDWDAMEAKNYEIYEDTVEGATEYVAKDSPFRCELPKEALGMALWHLIACQTIGEVQALTRQAWV